jgi:hypothetical protein
MIIWNLKYNSGNTFTALSEIAKQPDYPEREPNA